MTRMIRAHYLAKLAPQPTDKHQLSAVDFINPKTTADSPAPVYEGPGTEGDLVEVRVGGGVARPWDPAHPITALADSALAQMYAIAADHHMDPIFGPEVHAEVEAILADPGFDAPELRDLRSQAFLTIDNRDSRDLDQAMFIARDEGGFRVRYALADASYYMRPGSALFHAALSRGVTYYFPGFCVPMLPRPLSEDLVSLNPEVDRRALIFDMVLDASGEVLRTEVYRALIRSRAKLSYPGVQALHDHWDAGASQTHALDGHDYTETLTLLRTVGELRMNLAFERDVVRYRRRELLVHAGPEGTAFTLVEADRNDVERWNEQISLLCNAQGAQMLVDAGSQPNLQAIFRVHEPPHHRRVKALARGIRNLIAARDLDPELWSWRREQGESLAQFLDRLPREGDQGRRAKAIQRLALVINNRSEFSERAGAHHGVGADAYARFSSPMRELVGVFTHKEAVELLTGQAGAPAGPHDEALQTQIIELANRSKRRQSRVTKEANKVAITAVLEPLLGRPLADRPDFEGTLMGVSPTQAYVQLDAVPIELKVYFSDLDDHGGRPKPTDDEVGLELPGGERLVLGDAVYLSLLDRRRGRFVLRVRPR